MNDYIPNCVTCEHFYSCIMQKHNIEMALILWNISQEKKKETTDNFLTTTNIYKAIKEAEYRGYMKAVEDRLQREWISCEERLPEESGDYLVWMKYGMNAPTYWIESYDADEKAFGEWFDIDLFDSGMRREFMALQNIYAWMPLPEPYERSK